MAFFPHFFIGVHTLLLLMCMSSEKGFKFFGTKKDNKRKEITLCYSEEESTSPVHLSQILLPAQVETSVKAYLRRVILRALETSED